MKFWMDLGLTLIQYSCAIALEAMSMMVNIKYIILLTGRMDNLPPQQIERAAFDRCDPLNGALPIAGS
jgi:hypothetical protein